MNQPNPGLAKAKNLTWFDRSVNREDRERLHGHKGAVVWFTGLSASGKSTIANHLEEFLHDMNCSTYVFDGDNVRHGLNSDLGWVDSLFVLMSHPMFPLPLPLPRGEGKHWEWQESPPP